MSADALRSPVVSKIRETVPEFEDSFQTALAEEDGELGSFQAMSAFATWLIQRMQAGPDVPEVDRSFYVVEQIASSEDYPMGRALVTEFVEAVGHSSKAISRLGSASRAYLSSP
ncbi:MAG: hypothetical protein J7518_04645 [Nocardioidaceae bacterium]|nr:hypothetical protein [Nocardioidaceae bacterium]